MLVENEAFKIEDIRDIEKVKKGMRASLASKHPDHIDLFTNLVSDAC